MKLDRLLLDTHVFLWWRSDLRRLNQAAKDAISIAEVVFVSVVSAWEAAIKRSLGRLEMPDRFENGILDSGFEKLLLTFDHAEDVATLPHHHRDPFDRLLVIQATAENLTLVTHDQSIRPYDVRVLWT